MLKGHDKPFVAISNCHNIRLVLYGIRFCHEGFELTHAADAGIFRPRLPPEPVVRVAVLVPVKINFGLTIF